MDLSRIRIASVPYVNAEPLTWGFLHGPYREMFELERVPPAGIPECLLSGRADVGLIPTIELWRQNGLEILPRIGIASKRRARSVFLASKGPLETVRRVALDESSRTSAALLRVLLARRGLENIRFTPAAPSLRDMLQHADAALLIGDPALTAYTRGLEVFGLASEWFDMTGLPFVFAVWARRAGFLLPDGLRPFLDSRRMGMEAIPRIALSAGPRLRLAPEVIEEYLRINIHYFLGSEEDQALQLFRDHAVALGLVPSSPAWHPADIAPAPVETPSPASVETPSPAREVL